MIPRIDACSLRAGDPLTLDALRVAAQEIGFLVLTGTALDAARVTAVIAAYRDFFRRPEAEKRAVDMARTGSNRGWGAAQSEQVDPGANPDYKQVFDCGFELAAGDPLRGLDLPVYADNLWPARPARFRRIVQAYYSDALVVARDMLRGIARAIDAPEDYFDDKFTRPMALLRGNYYPERPTWAGEKDFGIAPHTDYGCLTLLATDGGWLPVAAQPGSFIINFGEMLEMWTEGQVVATLHRVKGSEQERISVPMFFNPNHDANVAPPGSGVVIRAGDHLAKRFNETYLHLKG